MIDLTPLFGEPHPHGQDTLDFRIFPESGPGRWMLESRFRRPWHLKTWPRANFRAHLIHRVAWTLGLLGLHLPSRIETIAVAPDSPYAQLRAEYDHLGIFLGTPGPNRKFVVFAERPGRSVFVKIPFGPVSKELVRNETAALAELARDPDLAALIPSQDTAGGHLALENLETQGTGYGELDPSEVARICGLLERRTRYSRPLGALRGDWEATPDAPTVTHDIKTQSRIDLARKAALRFLDSLPQETDIACYMAHGDFTRWNVLRAKDGTARVIDWELYGPKPLYFDLIHYFVSHALLATTRTPESILAHLEEFSGDLDATAPWPLHIGLYFSFQALYYCAVFERQERLNLSRQANWQLEAWADILLRLEDSCSTADHRPLGTGDQ